MILSRNYLYVSEEEEQGLNVGDFYIYRSKKGIQAKEAEISLRDKRRIMRA